MNRAYPPPRGCSTRCSLLGLTMVVSTLARGGGPFALGVVLGVLFLLLGAARLRLAHVAEPPAER